MAERTDGLDSDPTELKHMLWNPHVFPVYGTLEMFEENIPVVGESMAIQVKPEGTFATLYDAIRTPYQHVWAFDRLLKTLLMENALKKNSIPLSKILDVALLNQHFLVEEARKWQQQPYATATRADRLYIIVDELEHGAERLRELKGRSDRELEEAKWGADLLRRYLSQGYLWRACIVAYEKQEVAKQVWANGLRVCLEEWGKGGGRVERKDRRKKKERERMGVVDAEMREEMANLRCEETK